MSRSGEVIVTDTSAVGEVGPGADGAPPARGGMVPTVRGHVTYTKDGETFWATHGTTVTVAGACVGLVVLLAFVGRERGR